MKQKNKFLVRGFTPQTLQFRWYNCPREKCRVTSVIEDYDREGLRCLSCGHKPGDKLW